jgi:hypothetical protein
MIQWAALKAGWTRSQPYTVCTEAIRSQPHHKAIHPRSVALVPLLPPACLLKRTGRATETIIRRVVLQVNRDAGQLQQGLGLGELIQQVPERHVQIHLTGDSGPGGYNHGGQGSCRIRERQPPTRFRSSHTP